MGSWLGFGKPILSFQFGLAKVFQSTWGKGSGIFLNGPYLVASLSTMASKVEMASLADFLGVGIGASTWIGDSPGAGSRTGSRTSS